MFLLVIRGLMAHNLPTVRRRAMELFNTKLQNDLEFFKDCDESEILAMLPPILMVLKTFENDNFQTEDELIVQTALLSLKLLSKKLAASHPEKFVQILEYVTIVIKSGLVQGNILASIVLCLAELCSSLRAHSISNLNKFMPALIKVLKNLKTQDTPDLLLLSVVTAIQKILDNLALFLSPYLEKLLVEFCGLYTNFSVDKEAENLGAFGSKLISIRQKLGESLNT